MLRTSANLESAAWCCTSRIHPLRQCSRMYCVHTSQPKPGWTPRPARFVPCDVEVCMRALASSAYTVCRGSRLMQTSECDGSVMLAEFPTRLTPIQRRRTAVGGGRIGREKSGPAGHHVPQNNVSQRNRNADLGLELTNSNKAYSFVCVRLRTRSQHLRKVREKRRGR